MANKTPIDLTDQLALRRYLENLVVETPVFRPAAVQGDLTKLYSVPVLTSAELKYYVENLVKEFDTRMWTTINEVKYNLAQISAVLNKDTIDLGTLIVTDYTTTVDMNTKIATDIAVVTTDLTQNYYTAVGTDGAIASADTALKATIDSEYTNTATLELNYYTAVNTDAAIASAVTTLSTYVGDNYSTTSVINSTYATQTAVGAIYEVSVEANGHVSGYRSVATGTNSVFQIYAEQFAISSSSTTEGYSPFQVDTVNHKINMTSDVAIDGNLIVSGSVTSNQMSTNVALIGGYIASADFTTIGGAGFRLKSAAAGTSADPTIYGAYIRGGTIEGTTLVGVTVDATSSITAPIVYGNVYRSLSSADSTKSGLPIYSRFASRLHGSNYGTGYLETRVCSSSSTIQLSCNGVLDCDETYSFSSLALWYKTSIGSWTRISYLFISETSARELFGYKTITATIPYSSIPTEGYIDFAVVNITYSNNSTAQNTVPTAANSVTIVLTN